MFFWSALGMTGGYTIFKFLPLVKFIKAPSALTRNVSIGFSLIFMYYGYKLMER
jgi:hypothetical protein